MTLKKLDSFASSAAVIEVAFFSRTLVKNLGTVLPEDVSCLLRQRAKHPCPFFSQHENDVSGRMFDTDVPHVDRCNISVVAGPADTYVQPWLPGNADR